MENLGAEMSQSMKPSSSQILDSKKPTEMTAGAIFRAAARGPPRLASVTRTQPAGRVRISLSDLDR